MARVTLPDGRVFDVDDTDTQLLTYYRGEGGQISTLDPQVAGDDTIDADLVEVPAKSARKSDWVDFAKAVETDPQRQAEIDDLTHDQLVDRYENFGS